MRGHLLATTGNRLEDLDIGDFLDIVYNYAINPPSEYRNDFRSTMLGYAFDFKIETEPGEEDMSFDGFTKQSMSMLDELDAFGLG